MQAERLCMPSGERACTWQRFLPVPLLQVIFWEGQWWALPCFPPLWLGSLKAIAVSRRDPSGDVCLSWHTGSCLTYLAAGRCCQPTLCCCSVHWPGLGGGRQQQSVLPQQRPTATCSSWWRRACESGSKVSSSSCAPSCLGELLKTAQSLLCYRGNASFGRPCWFRKQLLFLPVRGIWCYPWISVSGFLCDMLEGLLCRCL